MHYYKTALQTVFGSMKASISPCRTGLKRDINLLDKMDCVCMSQ